MTDTLTLTDFLLARIAEDVEVARAAQHLDIGGDGKTWYSSRRDVLGTELLQGVMEDDPQFDEDFDVFTAATRNHAAHIARHDPARVLAEAEAKRRIIGLHAGTREFWHPGPLGDAVCDVSCAGCGRRDPCPTLIALALPSADHPDYRDEWRP